MIRTIGSYYFPGFYESVFNSSDDFIDEEYEVKDMLIEKYEDTLNKTNVEVIYEYENFDQYKVDVAVKFLEGYVEKIIEELPEYIVADKEFEFEMIDGSVWVTSPKYYNYETDKCYCNINTNLKTLELIKEYTLRMKGVKTYIKNHFSSYDGFISFISNDKDYWEELPISEYQDNMLICLLDMMLILSDEESINDISFDVMDCISKYEYAICYVDYNENRYSLYDFENKVMGADAK